jgi:hypothetical protein
MLSDELKRPDRRDQALQNIVTAGREFKAERLGRPRGELIVLAEAMIVDLKKDGKTELDVPALEKLCTEEDPAARAIFHYFLGRYLENHGQSEAAIEQWKKTMACNWINLEARTLAGDALARHGVLPEKYENPFAPKTEVDKPAATE